MTPHPESHDSSKSQSHQEPGKSECEQGKMISSVQFSSVAQSDNTDGRILWKRCSTGQQKIASMKHTWNKWESRLSQHWNRRYKEETTRQEGRIGRTGRAELQYSQHACPRWLTYNQEDNYNSRASPPRHERFSLHTAFPSIGVLHQEDKTPERLALKASRICL